MQQGLTRMLAKQAKKVATFFAWKYWGWMVKNGTISI
jgi:fatty acid-binding protein DegV